MIFSTFKTLFKRGNRGDVIVAAQARSNVKLFKESIFEKYPFPRKMITSTKALKTIFADIEQRSKDGFSLDTNKLKFV